MPDARAVVVSAASEVCHSLKEAMGVANIGARLLGGRHRPPPAGRHRPTADDPWWSCGLERWIAYVVSAS